MIPTEGIWNLQWNSENKLARRCRGRWPWGRAGAGATVKRWERGVIVSSISEDECWQIQETLKARYRRRTAVRGGRGLPEPDKTFIFELLLVRVLCVISHSRIPLHPWGGKQNSNQATSRTPPFPLPSQGLVLGSHLPRIRGCTVLWLKSTHPSLPPGSGLTSPTTDYFEPFSGYIIASLSSSLYSPYRCSISAKPHIESCNYPDCHLIASLFISSITAGPANSSWGQRERKGLLVAQCATDSSSLWYIYSSSWVQSKLMHRGNSFFHPHPFPSTLQRLLSLSPFLVSRSECASWIEVEQTICDPISLNLWQHSIHTIWAFTARYRPSEGCEITATLTSSSLTRYITANACVKSWLISGLWPPQCKFPCSE